MHKQFTAHCIFLVDGALHVRFPDGTVAELPKQALFRSAVLRTTFENVDVTNVFNLSDPYCHLQWWSQFVKGRVVPTEHPCHTRQLVRYLQACESATVTICHLSASCDHTCCKHSCHPVDVALASSDDSRRQPIARQCI